MKPGKQSYRAKPDCAAVPYSQLADLPPKMTPWCNPFTDIACGYRARPQLAVGDFWIEVIRKRSGSAGAIHDGMNRSPVGLVATIKNIPTVRQPHDKCEAPWHTPTTHEIVGMNNSPHRQVLQILTGARQTLYCNYSRLPIFVCQAHPLAFNTNVIGASKFPDLTVAIERVNTGPQSVSIKRAGRCDLNKLGSFFHLAHRPFPDFLLGPVQMAFPFEIVPDCFAIVIDSFSRRAFMRQWPKYRSYRGNLKRGVCAVSEFLTRAGQQPANHGKRGCSNSISSTAARTRCWQCPRAAFTIY